MLGPRDSALRRSGTASALVLGVALSSVASGCTTPVPLGTDSGPDVPSIDAPMLRPDVPGVDARIDGSSADTPTAPVDAPTSDAPLAVDAPTDTPTDVPPDAGSRCDMRFGSVPGYMRCSETATECVFYSGSVGGGGRNCRDLCEPLGSMCLLEERTSGSCMAEGTTSCGNPEPEVVCTCRL